MEETLGKDEKVELSDHEKSLIDVYLTLQNYGFKRAQNRQNMEWKLSFSIWTTLSIVITSLLKGDFAYPKVIINNDLISAFNGAFVFIALTIFFLHFLWMYGAGQRTRLDQMISLYFDGKIQNRINFEYPNEITELLAKGKKSAGKIISYSIGVQLIITLVLALSVIILIILYGKQ